jgi:hypothetical protein
LAVGGGDRGDGGGGGGLKCVGRARLPEVVGHPAPGVLGAGRGVLGDQVRRQGVALHVGLGQPADQVPQVAVGEDWVAGSPEEQDRHVQRRDPGGHRIQGRAAGVVGLDGDVGHEVVDAAASGGVDVGGGQRVPDRGGQRRPRQRAGGPDEGGGAGADGLAQGRVPGEPDQGGEPGVGGQHDAGVGQDHRGDLVAVPERPAERDRTTPVVRGDDHRSRHVERMQHPGQVVDPLRQGARRLQPVRPAHAQLVHGHHAPAGGGRGQESAPQVGPGGVAVDADHGADGGLGAVVQQVPGAADAVEIDDLHRAGPGRIHSGQ